MTAEEKLRCSFCLKIESDVARIIAGPGSYICDECVALCVRILGDATAESPADAQPELPSWAAMPDSDVLARLPVLATVVGQVERALEQWIGEARRRGVSWAAVGAALGISRQAAWERFSPAV